MGIKRTILSNLLKPLCGFGVHYCRSTKGVEQRFGVEYLQCINCGVIVKKNFEYNSILPKFIEGIYTHKPSGLKFTQSREEQLKVLAM